MGLNPWERDTDGLDLDDEYTARGHPETQGA